MPSPCSRCATSMRSSRVHRARSSPWRSRTARTPPCCSVSSTMAPRPASTTPRPSCDARRRHRWKGCRRLASHDGLGVVEAGLGAMVDETEQHGGVRAVLDRQGELLARWTRELLMEVAHRLHGDGIQSLLDWTDDRQELREVGQELASLSGLPQLDGATWGRFALEVVQDDVAWRLDLDPMATVVDDHEPLLLDGVKRISRSDDIGDAVDGELLDELAAHAVRRLH